MRYAAEADDERRAYTMPPPRADYAMRHAAAADAELMREPPLFHEIYAEPPLRR